MGHKTEGVGDDDAPELDDEGNVTAALSDTIGVSDACTDGLGVMVGDRKMATLRAVMVALDTPASLASQE